MKTKADYNVRLILLIWAAIIAACIVATSCNGCKQPAYIPPNPVQVIETKHNPIIDSLKKKNSLLSDSVSKLNAELVAQKKKTAISENKADATIDKLQSALAAKDTGKIIVYSEDAANDYTAFKQEVAQQDSIQDAVIEKQTAIIETSRAETELHETKFKELKTAYNIQSIQLSDYAQQNEKLQKKLKRSKFWNKVLGIGTAAGAVLAGIVLF